MKNNKTIYSVLGLFAFIIGSGYAFAQSWSPISGTEGKVINKLFAPASSPELIIATSDTDSLDLETYNPFSTLVAGNGIVVSRDGGNSFPNRYLDSILVFDVKKSMHHNSRWYASARYLDEGGVLISEDDGITWNLSEMKCKSSSSQKFAIAESPFDETYIATTAIATDEGYSYTTDNFQTCTEDKDFDIQSRCISFSKVKAGLIFIGGDATFADGVHRSNDSGKTWHKYSKGLENLRVLSVLASSVNPSLVFCGVDTIYDFMQKLYIGRGIYVSQDTGRTWRPIGATNTRVFDIQEHPVYSNFLAAACGSEGVFVSSGNGFNWEKQSTGFPAGSEVRSIAIPNNEPIGEKGFVCIAGTRGNGIFKSVPLFSTVESSNQNDIALSVFPNPCSNLLSVSWTNQETEYCSIEIIDVLGNTIANVFSGIAEKGLQTVSVNNLNQIMPAAGSYYLILKSQSGIHTKSIMKIN